MLGPWFCYDRKENIKAFEEVEFTKLFFYVSGNFMNVDLLFNHILELKKYV